MAPKEKPEKPAKSTSTAKPAKSKTSEHEKAKKPVKKTEKSQENPDKVKKKDKGREEGEKEKNKAKAKSTGGSKARSKVKNTQKSKENLKEKDTDKSGPSRIERKIEVKQTQFNEAKQKADEDAKSQTALLKRKSSLEKAVDTLESELDELKRNKLEERPKTVKRKKEGERKQKVVQKHRRRGGTDSGYVSFDEHGKPKPRMTTAQLADEARKERIVRRLEREWSTRDPEEEKRLNFERAVASAVRNRNAKQKALDDANLLKYFAEEQAKEEKATQEQRKKAEELIKGNKANVLWPLPGTVPRETPLSKAQEKMIRERFEAYVKEESPHRLQSYLQHDQNAAEVFRLEGGGLLQKRVEELYQEELDGAPHTLLPLSTDDQEDNPRAHYEQRRSKWHALWERYHHATGWPKAQPRAHWSEISDLDKLMQKSKSFRSSNARMANERIAMCNNDENALRETFEEIFLRIMFRKTRNRMTKHIPGGEPRARIKKTPMLDQNGDRIVLEKKLKTGAKTKQKRTYFTPHKWLKKKKRKIGDGKERDGEDDDGEPEEKKQKMSRGISKSPETGGGQAKGTGEGAMKTVEISVQVLEEEGGLGEGEATVSSGESEYSQ